MNSRVRVPLAGLLVVVSVSGCRMLSAGGGAADEGSAVKVDSASSQALDATIADGTILTHVALSQGALSPPCQLNNDDVAVLRAEVQQQLAYTVGQLNGLNGVGDLSHLQTSFDCFGITATGGGFVVPYAAQLVVALPQDLPTPDKLRLYVPRGGDDQALSAFMGKYQPKCTQPGTDPAELQQSTYWYYFRPVTPGCPFTGGFYDKTLVASPTMTFRPSAQQTQGKFPEYGKVWEDGRLVVTALFGQFSPDDFPPASDAGVQAFNDMVHQLVQTYGAPSDAGGQNVLGNASVAPSTRQLEMKWQLPGKGELDVRLMLVKGVQGPLLSDAERATYASWTTDADFVAYNAHSGLGANIRALADLGTARPGQYQVFMVNGCDTFAYVDDALRDQHATANGLPLQNGTKYLDLITNAMPTFFQSSAQDTMAVVNALVGQQLNYRQLLQGFAVIQRALVTGEEDNTWPGPFCPGGKRDTLAPRALRE